MGSDPLQGSLFLLPSQPGSQLWSSCRDFKGIPAPMTRHYFFDARRLLNQCSVSSALILTTDDVCRIMLESGEIQSVPCDIPYPLLCAHLFPLSTLDIELVEYQHALTLSDASLCTGASPQSPFHFVLQFKVESSRLTIKNTVKEQVGLDFMLLTVRECDTGAATAYYMLPSPFTPSSLDLHMNTPPKVVYKAGKLLLESLNPQQPAGVQIDLTLLLNLTSSCSHFIEQQWTQSSHYSYPFVSYQGSYHQRHLTVSDPHCFHLQGQLLIQFADPDFPILHSRLDKEDIQKQQFDTLTSQVHVKQRLAPGTVVDIPYLRQSKLVPSFESILNVAH